MALIRAFAHVDHDQQQRELELFAKSLSSVDARRLVGHINSSHRQFKRDIFGSVPVELCEAIARHLLPKDCFRLKRVSKLWQRRLDSERLLKSVLLPWHARYISQPDVDLRVIAESVSAYAEGKPLQASAYYDLEELQYCDGLIAVEIKPARSIGIFDIAQNRRSKITTTNREKILMFSISSELLVMLTELGRCYAWDASDPSGDPVYQVRLESAQCVKLLVSGRVVTLQHSSSRPPRMTQATETLKGFEDKTYASSLTVWVPETRRLTKCTILHAYTSQFRGPYLSDNCGSFVMIDLSDLITNEADSTNKALVRVFDLSGELLLELSQSLSLGDFRWLNTSTLDDQARNTILAYKYCGTTTGWTLQLCQYDSQQQMLRIEELSGDGHLLAHRWAFHRDLIFFIRKDDWKLYVLNHADRKNCRCMEVAFTATTYDNDPPYDEDDGDDTVIHMDDNFTIIDIKGFGAEFEVLCFNKMIDLDEEALSRHKFDPTEEEWMRFDADTEMWKVE